MGVKDDVIYKAIGEVNPDYLTEFEEIEERTMKKKMNWIAVAACCVLLMGAGVVTGLTDLPENVSRFLGMEDETQIKYLASAATSVDMLVEGEQGDIHIKEVMGDHNSVYIFFDFIAPEGTVLDNEYYEFSQVTVDLNLMNQSFGMFRLQDEDETDNKISFTYRIRTMESLNGEEISLKFRNLFGYNIDVDSTQVYVDEEIYRGVWQTESFKLKFTDQSNQYKVSQLVSENGGEFELTTVSISPFALTFEGKVHLYPLTSDKFDEIVENSKMDILHDWEISNITLHFADASSEEIEASGGFSEETFSYTYAFLPVLTQEIVAVTFMGERIELLG